jgi:hypothetical protein
VLTALEKRGNETLTSENIEDLNAMTKIVDDFDQEINNSKSNKLIIEI